jgi:hypothetical protein
MLTREDVEKMPWLGEQRSQVMELIEEVENLRAKLADVPPMFEMGKVLGPYLTAERRCELAVYLCEGTSMQVAPR